MNATQGTFTSLLLFQIHKVSQFLTNIAFLIACKHFQVKPII